MPSLVGMLEIQGMEPLNQVIEEMTISDLKQDHLSSETGHARKNTQSTVDQGCNPLAEPAILQNIGTAQRKAKTEQHLVQTDSVKTPSSSTLPTLHLS